MTAPSIVLIDEFLRGNGWEPLLGDARLRRYKPSPELGLAPDFALSVPVDAAAPGASPLLGRVVDTLAELHDLSSDQLRIVLAVPDTVVSLQIISEATSLGAIPLPQLEGLVDKLRRALLDTASFVLTDAPLLDDVASDEAEAYLNRCQFLQTERGSFVAKVQLPAAQQLADASFFKTEPVTSDDVNRRLQGVVDFAVNVILPGEPSDVLSDQLLESRGDVVSVNVLADLVGLFERIAATDLNIGFLSSREQHMYHSGVLTDARLQRLDDFVSFARARFSEEFPIEFRGKIVELRSRNPKGNRNHVLLQGIHEGRAVFVAFSLPQSDYWHATQAHAEGRTIRIAGYARHMKTQLKLVTRELFQIVDDESRSANT